ncbi:MAG: hypothetical protein IPF60_07035 [Betaproteobacteria bacterium]|nr:hypothetical protein [Betaproteobacteria bacterium]
MAPRIASRTTSCRHTVPSHQAVAFTASRAASVDTVSSLAIGASWCHRRRPDGQRGRVDDGARRRVEPLPPAMNHARDLLRSGQSLQALWLVACGQGVHLTLTAQNGLLPVYSARAPRARGCVRRNPPSAARSGTAVEEQRVESRLVETLQRERSQRASVLQRQQRRVRRFGKLVGTGGRDPAHARPRCASITSHSTVAASAHCRSSTASSAQCPLERACERP